MSVVKVASDISFKIINGLSTKIDFGRDLPANVFLSKGYDFWFFERPLTDFLEGLTALVSASYCDFSSDVFISFSGTSEKVCFLFDGKDVQTSTELLSIGFRNFFNGEVGYPMIIGDLGFNWLAYESAYEEFGVLALKSRSNCPSFKQALQQDFLASTQFQELQFKHEVMIKVVKAFHEYFN